MFEIFFTFFSLLQHNILLHVNNSNHMSPVIWGLATLYMSLVTPSDIIKGTYIKLNNLQHVHEMFNMGSVMSNVSSTICQVGVIPVKFEGISSQSKSSLSHPKLNLSHLQLSLSHPKSNLSHLKFESYSVGFESSRVIPCQVWVIPCQLWVFSSQVWVIPCHILVIPGQVLVIQSHVWVILSWF